MLSKVCRVFKVMIDQFVELQYIVELGADGMADCPSPLPVADRLNMLLSRRKAWASLEFKDRVTVPMPGTCQAYELVGGVFAKIMNIEGRSGSSRHFQASLLPNSEHSGREIVHQDIGLRTRDFAIDPTQDLLAHVVVDHDA
jgi:hypothetical protein